MEIKVGAVALPDVRQHLKLVDHVDAINTSLESLTSVTDLLRDGLGESNRLYVQSGLESLGDERKLPADTEDTTDLIRDIRQEHEDLAERAFKTLNDKMNEHTTALSLDLDRINISLDSLRTSYASLGDDTIQFTGIEDCPILSVDGKLCAFEEDSWDTLVSVVNFLEDYQAFIPKALNAMILAHKNSADVIPIEILKKALDDAPVIDGRCTTAYCDELNMDVAAVVKTDIMGGFELTQYQLEQWYDQTGLTLARQFPYTHCISVKPVLTSGQTTDVEITRDDLVESIAHALSVSKTLTKLLSLDGPKTTKSMLGDDDELYTQQQIATLYFRPILAIACSFFQVVSAYNRILFNLSKQRLSESIESFTFD